MSQFDVGTASARDTGSSIILTLSGISLRVDTDWRRRRYIKDQCFKKHTMHTRIILDTDYSEHAEET